MEGSYLHVDEESLEDWTVGSYLDMTVLAVYVRGRVRNKQFCMNIGGGELILECGGDKLFYTDGLILCCQALGVLCGMGGGGGSCRSG